MTSQTPTEIALAANMVRIGVEMALAALPLAERNIGRLEELVDAAVAAELSGALDRMGNPAVGGLIATELMRSIHSHLDGLRLDTALACLEGMGPSRLGHCLSIGPAILEMTPSLYDRHIRGVAMSHVHYGSLGVPGPETASALRALVEAIDRISGNDGEGSWVVSRGLSGPAGADLASIRSNAEALAVVADVRPGLLGYRRAA